VGHHRRPRPGSPTRAAGAPGPAGAMLRSVSAAAGVLATLAALQRCAAADLPVCPGEGRFERKCQFSDEHGWEFRVCQRLLGAGGAPRIIADGKDWWQLCFHTDNPTRWDGEILQNGGLSWCTCATCTSEIIAHVGCENIEINCDATDVDFVFQQRRPEWVPLMDCLKYKCPARALPLVQASGADLPAAGAAGAARRAAVLGWGLVAAAGLLSAAALAWRRASRTKSPPFIAVDTEERASWPPAVE